MLLYFSLDSIELYEVNYYPAQAIAFLHWKF